MRANDVRAARASCQRSPLQAWAAASEPINLTAYRLRRKPVLGGITGEYWIAA